VRSFAGDAWHEWTVLENKDVQMLTYVRNNGIHPQPIQASGGQFG